MQLGSTAHVPRRLFYGWYLVAGLGLTTIVSYGVTQYLFAVLVVPIQRDMGWSRAAISGAYALSYLVLGLLGVPIGRVVDRYGARGLMTAGSILGAACLFGLAGMTSLWQFYLLWAGGLGLAMAMTLYNVSFTVVANFFVRRRGQAMALLTVVGGLSSPIYIPLAGWLVARFGWRTALDLLAVTVLLVALPVHFLIVRRRPEDLGLHPDGGLVDPVQAATEPGGHHLGEALAGPVFWLLTAAAGMTSLAYSVILAHGVAFLEGHGYEAVVAAGVLGLVGLASLPGRFLFNIASDRLGPQGLLALCTVLQGAGVALLVLAGPAIFVAGFVIVYGLAFGAISPLRASVLAEHYGRRAYGAITGVQWVAISLASAVGPIFAGYLYDRLGDYRVAFAITAAAFVAAGLLVQATPRPEAAPGTSRSPAS
jgi:MFS family permease